MLEDISRHTDLIAICSISYVCSYTMGSLISFFRRPELDTNSQLESIDSNLKRLFEKRAAHIRSKADLYKKTRNYGLSIFILLVLALYISFPAQLIRRAILLIFVFIIYPVAVLLIRKFWKFYHDRQKKEADDKIKALEKQKEEILETVMEKEPYNKARELLKKFAPNLYKKDQEKPKIVQPVQRQKMVNGKLVVDKPKLPGRVENLPKPVPQTGGQVRPRDPRLNNTVCPSQTSPVNRPNFASPQTHRQQQNMRRPQTVRPLPDRLNQSRVDKIVGWVVGSNPEQMYALICKSCFQHNGLALKEEFEYLEFKCAYCHLLNPARKERPKPPRLEEQKPMDQPRFPVQPPPSQRGQGSRGPSTERGRPTTGSTPKNEPPKKVEKSVSNPKSDPEQSEKSDSEANLSERDGSESEPISKRDEDSGTESDQMEKNQTEADESVFDESILAQGPSSSKTTESESDDQEDTADTTVENEELSEL